MKLYKDGITVIVETPTDVDWYKRAGYVEVKDEPKPEPKQPEKEPVKK